MQSPLRDEHESLQRRLEELRKDNARLRAELAALPPRKRWYRPLVIVLLCILAAPVAWSAGRFAGSKVQAAVTP